jgi:hypothetical protein
MYGLSRSRKQFKARPLQSYICDTVNPLLKPSWAFWHKIIQILLQALGIRTCQKMAQSVVGLIHPLSFFFYELKVLYFLSSFN